MRWVRICVAYQPYKIPLPLHFALLCMYPIIHWFSIVYVVVFCLWLVACADWGWVSFEVFDSSADMILSFGTSCWGILTYSFFFPFNKKNKFFQIQTSSLVRTLHQYNCVKLEIFLIKSGATWLKNTQYCKSDQMLDSIGLRYLVGGSKVLVRDAYRSHHGLYPFKWLTSSVSAYLVWYPALLQIPGRS